MNMFKYWVCWEPGAWQSICRIINNVFINSTSPQNDTGMRLCDLTYVQTTFSADERNILFLWNLPGSTVLFVWKSVSSLSPACLLLPVFIPLKINGKLCFLLTFARVTTMLTKCFIWWFIVRIRIWKKHSVCYITICLWWLMYCNDCCLTRHQCFLLPSQHLSMINCHNWVCFQTIYS